MPADELDPRSYVRQRIEALQPELECPKSFAEFPAWQKGARSRLCALLGGLPWERGPLRAEIGEQRTFSGYRREQITFTSRPGLRVFAYFLVPESCPPRSPAIICLPGHGRGVDSIVGIAPDGTQRDLGCPAEYQSDFALRCVAEGYPTLAIEQVSFGHRRDAQARTTGTDASSCVRDSMAALMLGETITGWRVWDAMRGLDYLETRPEVDPQRLAVMGISGGGLAALWTGCLDTRVSATVVSGFFNTFRDSILAVDHCVDNFVPGLLAAIEMPDLAGLVAPRALFVESGTLDPVFPLPGFEHAVQRAHAIYTAYAATDRFGAEAFAGDHRFHGDGAFAFLARHLAI